MIPHWQTHCPMALGPLKKEGLRQAIDVVFELGTCFMVDMDSQILHTTERGAAALMEHDFEGRGR